MSEEVVTKQLGVRIPKALYDALRQEALDRNVTLTVLVVERLEEKGEREAPSIKPAPVAFQTTTVKSPDERAPVSRPKPELLAPSGTSPWVARDFSKTTQADRGRRKK